MATVPTGKLERELRKLYLQWVAGLPRHEGDLAAYIETFRVRSERLIQRMGGDVARLGVYLADFPAPRELVLSPVAGVIYSEMHAAAISAGIATGLNANDTARAMLHAGLDKSFRRLTRLARTETVSAYWKNQWDSTRGLDLVMVWSPEFGPRTCDYCKDRDGLVVEDPNIRDHPNGRCTLLPMRPERVEYRGTLQADGTIYVDPMWDEKVRQRTNTSLAGVAVAGLA
uniref:Capsid maturation protease n=1 Tax=Micrococcus phage Olihed TaxID=3092209 RepID=A0AAU6R5Z9_9CAUD